MATIEERLKELSMQLIYDGLGDESAYEKHSAAKAAIIADWNAAEKAIKHARNNLVALIEESQGIAGYHLNGDIARWDYFEEDDWFGIGQMERALSRMEGDLPAEETVV